MPLSRLPFAVPRWAFYALAAVAVLVVGFGGLRCARSSAYERGKLDERIAQTSAARTRLTAAMDSAEQAMTPALTALQRQNDSLKAIARQERVVAFSAIARARRAEQFAESVPDSLMDVAPPEVVALVDSLRFSLAAVRSESERLLARTLELEARTDSALATAIRWRELYQTARFTLDTAKKEIALLSKKKDPPRWGFRWGVVTGAVAATAAIIATAAATR